MPFQSVPNGIGIYIIGNSAGQEIVNDFYVTKVGYNHADLVALATLVDSWVASSWLNNFTADYTYLRTEVRGLQSAIDLQATEDAHAGSGTYEGSCEANNVSLAVARKSGFTGRGARGRIFLPPLPIEVVDPATNMVQDVYLGVVTAALDTLSAAMNTAGFVPVIVHRVAAGVPLVPAVVFTLLEWVVVDKVIDSMRRRLPKRGI